MKHVQFGDKSLFMDDETADLLIAYANALGKEDSSDTVQVRAVGADGNEVEVEMLLNASAQLATESTNSGLEPPRDEAVIRSMTERYEALTHPPEALAHEVDEKDARRAERDDERL